MPSSKTCSFCGENITPGTGLMYVRNDGSILYFCSSKCKKNMDFGRKPEDLEWTKKSREAKE